MLDLLPFAEHSEKLPTEFLQEKKVKPSGTWPIVASHFIDFFMALTISSIMTTLCNQSIRMLLMTGGLRKAYALHDITHAAGSVLPLVILSYFFLSYFMNDGQTYGMYLLKKRVTMQPKNFRDAFTWAVRSSLLCFSCGLYYFFSKSSWESIREHDHLYEELLAHKDVYTINLLERIETLPEITEEWSRAA